MTTRSRLALGYLTSQFPYGRAESFLEPEIQALADLGYAVHVVPVQCPGVPRPHAGSSTFALGYRHVGVWARFVGYALLHLPTMARLLRGLAHDKAHLVRNLAVLPLGVEVGRWAARSGLSHLHAHWLSTTATAAWVAHEVSGIPYSITAHRWDIADGNLRALKLRTASFVRCISESGKRSLAGDDAELGRIEVSHLGARLPSTEPGPAPTDTHPDTLVAVGNLIPVKGHRYLLEAMSLLIAQGLHVRLDIIGEGELLASLQERASALGIADLVRFLGQLPHPEVESLLQTRQYLAMVMPSLDLGQGVHEGIPVSLMEAMSRGVPVIATTTGGIPELVADRESGLLVPPADAAALAGAIARRRACSM